MVYFDIKGYYYKDTISQTGGIRSIIRTEPGKYIIEVIPFLALFYYNVNINNYPVNPTVNYLDNYTFELIIPRSDYQPDDYNFSFFFTIIPK